MSCVVTFYRFANLSDLEGFRQRLESRAGQQGLRGTILIAQEGINGTLTGDEQELRAFAAWLGGYSPQVDDVPGQVDNVPGRADGFRPLADTLFKYSSADRNNPVFHRLKVRIKPEIVALGHPEINPATRTGTHVDAPTWNRLLDDPDLIVVDTRNGYEIDIGTFPGAVDPGTTSFKQFPDFVAGLDPQQHPRVAMFCTGGVRCEKASAYMLALGFEEVYQLDGGILKYLETVDPAENRWAGECFVFDQRVSVDQYLEEGTYEQCFACRRALTAEDMTSPEYVQGVSCPHCAGGQDAQRRQGFAERQRQVELAAARGDLHVGKTMPERPQRSSSGSR
jgi:UPF0176 protein